MRNFVRAVPAVVVPACVRAPVKAKHLIIFLFEEKMRHKTLICLAYLAHKYVEGTNEHVAGQFYIVLELLHAMVG